METQKESRIENVIVGNFRLMESPEMAQITIHINNLIGTYGPKIINEFKSYLYQNDKYIGLTISQLINHYGDDIIKEYFSLIYAWEFPKKVG